MQPNTEEMDTREGIIGNLLSIVQVLRHYLGNDILIDVIATDKCVIICSCHLVAFQ